LNTLKKVSNNQITDSTGLSYDNHTGLSAKNNAECLFGEIVEQYIDNDDRMVFVIDDGAVLTPNAWALSYPRAKCDGTVPFVKLYFRR
jgi:hypothetical protein